MSDTKLCPYCREDIKADAIKCKHCGSMLEELPKSYPQTDPLTFIRHALSRKYEILSEIGKGGMATVYKAVQKNLDRTVALKVLSHQASFDKEFVERFHREARTCAKLNHPNIILIHDEGEEQGVHYIAMELLEGEDLHNMVKRQGPLSAEKVRQVIIPIAEALEYAHSFSIVHRDVKSANIFLTKAGRPVLTDFGIAHAAKGTQLTMSGSVLGTPEFMSPEQADGKPIDGRSDVYSLGVVMYYAATGHFPYSGDNPLTTIYKILNDNYRPVRSVKPGVPEWLEEIIHSCLSKNAGKRIQSGRMLADALRTGKTITKPPSAPPYAPSVPSGTIKIEKKEDAGINWEKLHEVQGASPPVMKPAQKGLKLDDGPPYSITNTEKTKVTISSAPPIEKPQTHSSVYDIEKEKKSEGALFPRMLILIFVGVLVVVLVNLLSSSGSQSAAPVEPGYRQDYPKESAPAYQPPATQPQKTKEPAEVEKQEVEKVAVPDVVGADESIAKRSISRAGLSVGTVVTQLSAENVGIVIKQRPSAGSRVSKGASVNLVVGE